MGIRVAPVVLALLGLSEPAAEPGPLPSLELTWDAPKACPDAAHVRGEIVRLLGPFARAEHPPLSAQGRIERAEGGRYALTLVLRSDDAAGERTLDAADCEQLASAAALVIAIAIEPRVLESVDEDREDGLVAEPKAGSGSEPGSEAESESEPETGSEPESEPRSEPEAETDAESETGAESEAAAQTDADSALAPARARGPLHVGAGIGAGVGLGILPGPAGDLGVMVVLAGRLWRVELGGSYWTPSDRSPADNPDIAGRFFAWGIDVRGCPTPFVGSVSFPLCAGLEVGAVHGRGRGDLVPTSAASVWVGALAGVAVLWRPRAVRERLGLGLRGEGVASLTRPTFGTPQSGVIYRVRPGGARVGAIIEVRFR